MEIRIDQNRAAQTNEEPFIRIICPKCKERGLFEVLASHGLDLLVQTSGGVVIEGETIPTTGHAGAIMGQRRCANPQCHAHIFFGWENGKVVACYPASRIPFDTTNIPKDVVDAMEEAIICHANGCYKASALMVRKTLEVLSDAQGSAGKNLKERLDKLRQKIALPPALLDALHDLRLLGNDAGHVELKDFDQIGLDESAAALDIAKEILKGVYQYEALTGRLAALKTKPASQTP
jgi:hypothetical protein